MVQKALSGIERQKAIIHNIICSFNVNDEINIKQLHLTLNKYTYGVRLHTVVSVCVDLIEKGYLKGIEKPLDQLTRSEKMSRIDGKYAYVCSVKPIDSIQIYRSKRGRVKRRINTDTNNLIVETVLNID